MVETLIGPLLFWTAIVYLAGSICVLERHCLGQMAFVQPLTLCLAVGLITGNEAVGIWLGVSLQLFSTAFRQHVDWSVSGAIGAASILIAPNLGLEPLPVGGPTCVILLIAVLVGMGARRWEWRFAKLDGQRLRKIDPWSQDRPAEMIAQLVRRSIGRWLLLGGFEVTAGTALAIAALVGLTQVFGWAFSHHGVSAIIVPALGIAIMINMLAGYRYVIWAGATTVVTWVVFI